MALITSCWDTMQHSGSFMYDYAWVISVQAIFKQAIFFCKGTNNMLYVTS